ncbi:MAG: tripartite tricarboxylate transporter TctB family protein [Betaproteobacteria bacterium]
MRWGATGPRAELLIALGVLAVGVAATVVAFALPEGGGYARVGPNAVPKSVALGLVLLACWLLAEVFTGGFRDRVPEDPAARGEHAFCWPAVGWVTAGLVAQMLLIGRAGFVLAAAVLFACVARGFGSRRLARDAALGLLLGMAVFLFFVKFLNVNLPAGWLLPLLGAAGL